MLDVTYIHLFDLNESFMLALILLWSLLVHSTIKYRKQEFTIYPQYVFQVQILIGPTPNNAQRKLGVHKKQSLTKPG
ncbi:hypothetical protein B8W93_05440 [Lentilactobacillus kefiri]|uniref:Uncharacterized protein n=1 Tax=Lentilactobacillus kefiri TaxID=33962 RepID=A0A511DUK8_LENKE|nr:hypothetical protein B8W85_05155 [Lentilactobacillus kefiri]PAL06545.1 hypothetical protein B8W93_05440 [Lentilactobacillus kefiri]QGV24464.1 hypothetical protein DNL43_03965 [Lentilactobacillus kefiri]GEL28520.1 hypothetical protein LKE01_13400 [Lentilactobacillus kefiri]